MPSTHAVFVTDFRISRQSSSGDADGGVLLTFIEHGNGDINPSISMSAFSARALIAELEKVLKPLPKSD